MRLIPSMVQRVSSSMLPTHMLPFSSLATCPETKMKSPARTAGWNGKVPFLPIALMSFALSLICPPWIVALQDRSLDDVDAALPVDQIAEAAIVDRHVVRRREFEALRRIRFVEADLARRVGIGDIEQTQSLGEPGKRDDGALEPFRRLVAAHHRGLRRAVLVQPLDLPGRDRHRALLVGDVVDPGEGGRRR